MNPQRQPVNNVKLLKRLFVLAALLVPLLLIPATYAQNPAPVQPETQVLSPETQNFILNLLTVLVAKYPWLATVITVIGSMRLWAKPVFSALHALTDITATKWDDGLWSRMYVFFTQHPMGRILAYLLDWLGSVKIQPPAPKEDKQ